MPLIKGSSKKSLSKNIATEMNNGKPQPQAIAIAESVKRKAMKKPEKAVEIKNVKKIKTPESYQPKPRKSSRHSWD